MPFKSLEKNVEYKKFYYEAHKEEYKKRDWERRQRTNAWLKSYKNTLVCEECGEDRWQCLDFHHVDPKKKSFTINHMVRQRFSVEKILEEIAKCKCICANCHRLHHNGNVWDES